MSHPAQVLGIKLRALYSLDCCAISPAPWLVLTVHLTDRILTFPRGHTSYCVLECVPKTGLPEVGRSPMMGWGLQTEQKGESDRMSVSLSVSGVHIM